jgi:hypothetical protein
VPPVIRPGDVIVGLLSTNAPVVTTRYLTAPPGWAGYADDYLLQGLQPGATVILRLDSSDFDTFLEVRSLGQGVASDDNNGGGSNSRYPLDVGPTTDRDYIIRVTSSTNLGVGYYTLRVEQSLAPQILSFGPSSGVPGALVRVRGLNFLNASGISQITAVRFGSVQAAIPEDPFTDGVEEAVDVLVPEGAVTGPITVETFNGTATSTSNFVVLGRIGFLRRETGGGFSFGVTNGASNLMSVVEATTSLSPPVVWQPVATNLILNPQVWRYTNQTLSPFGERFFRVTVK